MANFDPSQGVKISNPRADQIQAALTAATDIRHIERRPYLLKSWLDSMQHHLFIDSPTRAHPS